MLARPSASDDRKFRSACVLFASESGVKIPGPIHSPEDFCSPASAAAKSEAVRAMPSVGNPSRAVHRQFAAKPMVSNAWARHSLLECRAHGWWLESYFETELDSTGVIGPVVSTEVGVKLVACCRVEIGRGVHAVELRVIECVVGFKP